MNWTAKRLKYTARVDYGLGQPPALSETGIPILRATNVTRGKITSDGLIYAAKADLPLDRAPLLREGEILVVRSGAYTGDSALITNAWAGSQGACKVGLIAGLVCVRAGHGDGAGRAWCGVR